MKIVQVDYPIKERGHDSNMNLGDHLIRCKICGSVIKFEDTDLLFHRIASIIKCPLCGYEHSLPKKYRIYSETSFGMIVCGYEIIETIDNINTITDTTLLRNAMENIDEFITDRVQKILSSKMNSSTRPCKTFNMDAFNNRVALCEAYRLRYKELTGENIHEPYHQAVKCGSKVDLTEFLGNQYMLTLI